MRPASTACGDARALSLAPRTLRHLGPFCSPKYFVNTHIILMAATRAPQTRANGIAQVPGGRHVSTSTTALHPRVGT
eukprot:4257457-Prymnesium_polylepis.1